MLKKKSRDQRRPWMLAGLLGDVLLLCYFKYMDFFIENINAAAGTSFTLLHIMLPLGISFFTITQMVYLVDAEEGGVKDNNILHYALFVSFFPHLLSGPILHHRPMMKQFADVRTKVFQADNFMRGFTLLSIGLFKKICIADTFAPYVDAGFQHTQILSFGESWMLAVFYAFQLYFDFSGYSDMAVGVSRMFNIKIPINFNSPAKAVNVVDFWKRWHISLTNVITDYLYISVVQSFRSATMAIRMISSLITMTIIGFWHGAGWSYILYGAMHGTALMCNQYTKQNKIEIPHLAARVCTVVFVLLSFVMFRAGTISDAVSVYQGMIGMHGFFSHTAGMPKDFFRSSVLTLATICALLMFFAPNSNELIKRMKPSVKWGIATGLLFAYGFFSITKQTIFLYFQF